MTLQEQDTEGCTGIPGRIMHQEALLSTVRITNWSEEWARDEVQLASKPKQWLSQDFGPFPAQYNVKYKIKIGGEATKVTFFENGTGKTEKANLDSKKPFNMFWRLRDQTQLIITSNGIKGCRQIWKLSTSASSNDIVLTPQGTLDERCHGAAGFFPVTEITLTHPPSKRSSQVPLSESIKAAQANPQGSPTSEDLTQSEPNQDVSNRPSLNENHSVDSTTGEFPESLQNDGKARDRRRSAQENYWNSHRPDDLRLMSKGKPRHPKVESWEGETLPPPSKAMKLNEATSVFGPFPALFEVQYEGTSSRKPIKLTLLADGTVQAEVQGDSQFRQFQWQLVDGYFTLIHGNPPLCQAAWFVELVHRREFNLKYRYTGQSCDFISGMLTSENLKLKRISSSESSQERPMFQLNKPSKAYIPTQADRDLMEIFGPFPAQYRISYLKPAIGAPKQWVFHRDGTGVLLAPGALSQKITWYMKSDQFHIRSASNPRCAPYWSVRAVDDGLFEFSRLSPGDTGCANILSGTTPKTFRIAKIPSSESINLSISSKLLAPFPALFKLFYMTPMPQAPVKLELSENGQGQLLFSSDRPSKPLAVVWRLNHEELEIAAPGKSSCMQSWTISTLDGLLALTQSNIDSLRCRRNRLIPAASVMLTRDAVRKEDPLRPGPIQGNVPSLPHILIDYPIEFDIQYVSEGENGPTELRLFENGTAVSRVSQDPGSEEPNLKWELVDRMLTLTSLSAPSCWQQWMGQRTGSSIELTIAKMADDSCQLHPELIPSENVTLNRISKAGV
jgi:hypothetical protein